MKIDVATDVVSALAATLRQGAEDLGAVQRGTFDLWAPDLRSGSAALDRAVFGLRWSWTPQIVNLRSDVYRLASALTAVTTAYDSVETGAASAMSVPTAGPPSSQGPS